MNKLNIVENLSMPKWAKTMLVIVGTTAFIVIMAKLVKFVLPSEQQKKNKELLQSADQEIEKFNRSGLNQSFQDSQYLQFANTIYESMRYAAGDDYGKVVEIMKKMQNNLDVAKLIKAFGARQDYFFGIDEGSPKDLFTFIQSELGNEYAGLTSYRISEINKDWKKKGITYVL